VCPFRMTATTALWCRTPHAAMAAIEAVAAGRTAVNARRWTGTRESARPRGAARRAVTRRSSGDRVGESVQRASAAPELASAISSRRTVSVKQTDPPLSHHAIVDVVGNGTPPGANV
jgi:hypothetical protein